MVTLRCRESGRMGPATAAPPGSCGRPAGPPPGAGPASRIRSRPVSGARPRGGPRSRPRFRVRPRPRLRPRFRVSPRPRDRPSFRPPWSRPELRPCFRLRPARPAAPARTARVLPSGGPTARGGVQLDDTRAPDGGVVPGVLSLISKATCGERDGVEHCVSADDLRAAMTDTDPAVLGVPEWALESVRAADPRRRLEGLLVPGRYDVP